jgi:7-cyano-7-deazaguanine synthase
MHQNWAREPSRVVPLRHPRHKVARGGGSLERALVLLSGGLDSAACAYLLQKQGLKVEGLFVEYGQAALDRERQASAEVARSLGIPLRTQALYPSPSRSAGELPGRNALLISLGVFELGPSGGLVAIGVHAGTRYYDCSLPFLDAMSRLVQEQTDGRSALSAPLASWTKAQVFKVFNESGIPLRTTYSCEAGAEPCGNCLSCADRVALEC